MNAYSRRRLLQLGGLAGGYLLSQRMLPGFALGQAATRGPGAARAAFGAAAGGYQAGAFAATELLGRPTDRSVTVSVVPAGDLEAYVEYGMASGSYPLRTGAAALTADQPFAALLDGLAPNARAYYRLRYRAPGAAEFAVGPEHRLQTQRAPGDAFSFAVQADAHLGTAKHCDPDLYGRTVGHIAAGEPDFFIDLGDTFRTTKLKDTNRGAIERLYLNQRTYLGLPGASAPVFLVNGNHEMEWGWLLDGTAECVPAMCGQARKAYYPQPEPDAFYSGNAEALPGVGLPQDYYAWHWGDALFVVIDPYWHTPTDPGGAGLDKVTGDDTPKDPWAWTLGEAQYRWFQRTLAASPARYKFVFHHHVLGACRGGVEWADYYEWGGRDRNGADTFAQRRPGWELPIHPLMVKHGVTIFFQGHDHVFVRQDRGGVTYQTVPMPADPTYTAYNSDAFLSGDKLPNTGHLRVRVAPEQVTVDYVRSFLPADEVDGHHDGEVAFSYSVRGGGAAPTPGTTATTTPTATAKPPTPTALPEPRTPTPTTAPPRRRVYLPFAGSERY